jgi:hypothetical protein
MSSRNLTLAFTLLLASLPSLTHAAPVVTLEAQSLVVSGLPPGGEVVYFSVSREPLGYVSAVVRREGRAKDADLDGRLQVELEAPITSRSIWVVVELATGVVIPATPDGYPLVAGPTGGLALAVAGTWTHLQAQANRAYALVVRPGVGAWVATLSDGSPTDEDGSGNRTIVSPLTDLEPVDGGPPPPLELLAGDRVIEIDSGDMTYSAEIVGGAP